MTMDEALQAIEAFLLRYKEDHDDWNPSEIRVLPSGDEQDHIKIWFNFPDGTANVDGLKDAAVEALTAAHPEVSEFQLEVRADTGA